MVLTICPNPAIDKFLHLPRFSKGSVNRSLGERAFPGGKGVHVALAAKEMGADCVLVGFWGGPTGNWIKGECDKSGIKCIGPEIPGWNRTCLTFNSKCEANNTEVVERGPEVSGSHIDQMVNRIKEYIKEADALSVSGSWPPGSPQTVYSDLKQLANSANIPLWVDASGKRLEEALKVAPFGIHINRTEAETLLGPGKSAGYYAKALLTYCSMAAVTNGADGLYLAQGNDIIHAHCPVDEIISTVGCGDCLLAGLIVSLMQNENLQDVARTGVACGAANCVRPELGMLYNKDIHRFKKQVSCDEVTIHD